ncbi:MAG: acetyl-CoA carboxylase biotin carboxyl carrier protein subunit [Pseudomonadota bacterium]
MDIKEIKQLIDVMCASSLTNLEIEQDGTRIKLERTAQGQIVASSNSIEYVREISAPLSTDPATSTCTPDAVASNKGAKEVKAPMVGTFHELTTKKIAVGAKLKSGDVLCIVEAMKLMNEISITEPGEIVTIEVAEGDMVEFGQVLFTYN